MNTSAKRGRPYGSMELTGVTFVTQVPAPASGWRGMSLRVTGETASPGAVERLAYVPALGVVVAVRGSDHREYPVANIAQMMFAVSPLVSDE